MKISLKNHLSHLHMLLIEVPIILLAIWYFTKDDQGIVLTQYSLYMGPLLAFTLFPTLVLHFNYFFRNKDYQVFIKGRNLRVTVKNREFLITPDIVSNLEYHVSPAMYEERFLWLPWDYYRHLVINMKSGEKLVITSLLMDDFKFFLSNDFDVEVNKSLFRFAKT